MAVQPRVLKGFRDYLPERMIARMRFIRRVQECFERYGFLPVETPALELAELLLTKGGDEVARQVYRFTDSGGRDVCLRYDLTVPLARMIAQHGQALPSPFKRYQIAPAWRGEKPQRGRFREFYQCDADIVGSDSLAADAECLAVGCDLMAAVGIDEYRIRISHRRILDGLAASMGVDGADAHALYRAVDKIDKIGVEGAVAEIRKFAPEVAADALKGFLDLNGVIDSLDPLVALDETKRLFGGRGAGAEGVAELRGMIERAAEMGVAAGHLAIDISIARGMDYYTGAIFETIAQRMPELGSVMSGGRYDGLIGTFSGKDVSAVGISLGLDRIFDGLAEEGELELPRSTAKVMVTLFDDEGRAAAHALARRLREVGVAVEVPLERRALKKQIRAADRGGVPYVAIQGPDERAKGAWNLKDLRSGEERAFDEEALIARLGERGEGVE
ncbi:MAG: histidine--tRNA ligase [Gemmatimonadetes bacterium]|nr:histidine--tRNA ligase [Gemmatimonadota bacterium]